jgi:hypothetical protein
VEKAFLCDLLSTQILRLKRDYPLLFLTWSDIQPIFSTYLPYFIRAFLAFKGADDASKGVAKTTAPTHPQVYEYL